MRWVIGLAVAFGLVVSANMVMIYFAVSTPNPVSESYKEAPR